MALTNISPSILLVSVTRLSPYLFSLPWFFGKTANLQTAEYGRTDLKTCPDAAANTTDCRGPDIADSLRPQCDDKSECHVMVGTHLQTTDTCPGTSKYLHVAYDCAREYDNYAAGHMIMF